MCCRAGFCFLVSDSEMVFRILAFPADTLDKGPVQCYGPLLRAVANAKATVPAFFREEDNGRVSFYRMGDQDVHRTDMNANVTT